MQQGVHLGKALTALPLADRLAADVQLFRHVIADFYTEEQKEAFQRRFVWHIAGGVGAILFAGPALRKWPWPAA